MLFNGVLGYFDANFEILLLLFFCVYLLSVIFFLRFFPTVPPPSTHLVSGTELVGICNPGPAVPNM